ncbi:hypothetical protein AGLY_003153 [Aphis glycines]|uniref:Uncharacterized protein n=1 Tax=Aphis glycines TaxID=307491 RepID=A0A6G0U4N3_APHGL|nr:hypothetical protein AGLY_003153 [Aphis glycines]
MGTQNQWASGPCPLAPLNPDLSANRYSENGFNGREMRRAGPAEAINKFIIFWDAWLLKNSCICHLDPIVTMNTLLSIAQKLWSFLKNIHKYEKSRTILNRTTSTLFARHPEIRSCSLSQRVTDNIRKTRSSGIRSNRILIFELGSYKPLLSPKTADRLNLTWIWFVTIRKRIRYTSYDQGVLITNIINESP